jgi:DNA-binding LytR/AlgR family response regulator
MVTFQSHVARSLMLTGNDHHQSGSTKHTKGCDANDWIVVCQSNVSCLKENGGIHLCNLSLNMLEEKLDPARFLRVHRSSIISNSGIEQLQSDGEGGFVAMMKDKSTVKISRTHAAKLRNIIW